MCVLISFFVTQAISVVIDVIECLETFSVYQTLGNALKKSHYQFCVYQIGLHFLNLSLKIKPLDLWQTMIYRCN